MKTGFSLIDFDVVFLMQSPEFIKLLNLGNNLKKKNCKKSNSKFHFQLKYMMKKLLNITEIVTLPKST